MITKALLKRFLLGDAKSLDDPRLFHKISLIAFFAWIGLGADALSSSTYGPEEAFIALGAYPALAIFVALISAITIFVLSKSYSLVAEAFPAGGGGYLVASKLLSPKCGMISGCALLIDYVLTISISIAAGAAAVFSFLPSEWQHFRLLLAILGIFLLSLLNLRGVKESIKMVTPIFFVFVITHVFLILYGIFTHTKNFSTLTSNIGANLQDAQAELALAGVIFLILKAYTLGAGTYTGLEAVSNGMATFREPQVGTAKKAMRYIAISLIVAVVGLTLLYLLYQVKSVPGKTLNAVLFEGITANWGATGHLLLIVTLVSEAAILFLAAQTGFISGPRVLANMSLDKWFPSRFSTLSDRFVIKNGILMMCLFSAITLILTGASVSFLVVLYSVNVFITFTLSNLGMILHWWHSRKLVEKWKKKLLINFTGFGLSVLILISVIVFKFNQGGWIVLVVTGGLICLALLIKRHYIGIKKRTEKYKHLVFEADHNPDFLPKCEPQDFSPESKTAVILVRGFTGLGLHTLLAINSTFSRVFRNFVFVEIGSIHAGNFKSSEQVDQVRQRIRGDVDRYVHLVEKFGYHSEGFTAVSVDVVDEVDKLASQIIKKYPNSVFFGGQIVFPHDTLLSKILHNYTVFAVQRRLYHQGITLVLLPALI